jgi:mevalonate kinase
MKQRFYSNGKLLLTGEYIVLDGAKALALPTTFGQDLTVENGTDETISWKSFDSDGSIWFEGTIAIRELATAKNPLDEETVRGTLIDILREAQKLNREFLADNNGFNVETRLTFPKRWGLGTSSTLINNIAQWAKVDAFALLKNSFGGSGYDIACAQNDMPIVYQLVNEVPNVAKVDFRPDFSDYLYFVYLNRKQSSKAAIASYYNNRMIDLQQHIESINGITEKVVNAENIGVFARQLEKHESIISDIVEMKTVREVFFPDFDGVVKSLGGWGGDFILAVSKTDPSGYFRGRGFDTIVPYRDMILRQTI